ncbi:hypothetical protein T439DRAFT_50916 [Meredithblackwellia eburnea MCA 4105]
MLRLGLLPRELRALLLASNSYNSTRQSAPKKLSFSSIARSNQSPSSLAEPAETAGGNGNVIDELEKRGMIQDLTSRSIRTHLASQRTIYLGVDPSASSLHVGNLLALIGLLHFRLKGHNTIALIGGATGSVGDPSGRSTERNALDPKVLNHNIECITKQVHRFLDRGVGFAKERIEPRSVASLNAGKKMEEEGKVSVRNNLEWLGGMSLLQFLGSVGKGARVSTMLSRESVKSRLNSTSGISFTEFTYQLLQAFDFLHLHRTAGCTIQLGGSDQLGNIMSGIEMVRKEKLDLENVKEKDGEEDPAYGVTLPLLTTAAGEKFGKSAGNAVWLDAGMTSPFELYQFFLRTTDDEVLKYLKIFTFIRVEELDGIMADHRASPNHRLAQKVLAAEATALVHGSSGLSQALSSTTLFFSNTTELAALDLEKVVHDLGGNLEEGVPSVLTRLRKEDWLGGKVEKLLVESGVVGSKTQARKSLESGTISLNGVKLPSGPKSFQRTLNSDDILPIQDKAEKGLLVIKMGKSGGKAVLLE